MYFKVGQKIKLLRMSRKVLQRDLAARLRIRENALSKIETGRMDVPPALLKRIADELSVDISVLREGEPEDKAA